MKLAMRTSSPFAVARASMSISLSPSASAVNDPPLRCAEPSAVGFVANSPSRTEHPAPGEPPRELPLMDSGVGR